MLGRAEYLPGKSLVENTRLMATTYRKRGLIAVCVSRCLGLAAFKTTIPGVPLIL